jgi:multiple sugar transport system substrate-binding protein
MFDSRKLSRRDLLKVGAVGMGAVALEACAAPAAAPSTPQIIEVTKVVEKEKVVEKAVEVTKVVEKEKEVEKKVEVVITATAVPAVQATGPIKMVGWGYHPEIVEDNVKKFKAEYGEEVDQQLTSGGNYHQIVETKFLGGEKPWLVYSETEYMYRWWKAGFIQDCEDVLDQPTSFYKEEMYPFGVQHLSLPNGNLAALPYYSGYIAFVCNKDHMAKANLKPPATWDEMIEQCGELQAKGISKNPYVSAQNHEWSSLSWSIFGTWYSEGEYVFDKDHNPTFKDGGVAFKKVIDMHKTWYDKGITPPDILTQTGESVPAFMTGEHTYMAVHDYDQQGFNTGEKSNVKNGVVNALMPGKTQETFSWSACYLMCAKDVDRQRTWNLMQWLGGKAKDGQYHGNKRWALETGLGSPHKDIMEDKEVIASWEKWRDLDVHKKQLEKGVSRNIEKTMWFPEWNWQMMTEVQDVIQGKKTSDEAVKNLIALCDSLKAQYPET